MRSHATCLSVLIVGALAGQAWGKDLKPLSDSALSDLRGGFVTAGGFTFDIGISTSTWINGRLALASSVATSPTAPTGPTAPTAPTAPTSPTSPTNAGGGSAGSTGSANSAAPAVGAPTVTVSAGTPTVTTPTVTVSTAGPAVSTPTVTVSSASPAASPAAQPQVAQAQTPATPASAPQTPAAPTVVAQNQPASGPTGSAGASTITTTTSDGGATTVIQNPSQVINAVTNSANGQDIRLNTAVNIVLPGYEAVQRSQLLSGMGMKLGADGSFGIVSALPH
ncbi:MAG TPA: hypothetical protein VGM25_12475 [Caulobacteraceae bacterium]|jgi:hypothetical protein